MKRASGCSPTSETAVGVDDVAPEFSLKDLAGRTVRLSDFKGKVVLIDFWATYCLPCHDAIPAFGQLYEKYRLEGLEVVGISVDAYAGHIPDFVKDHDMKYTVVLDPTQETAEVYGLSQLPTTVLVGRTGKIRRKWLGYDAVIGEEIAAEVKSSLES